MSEPLVHIALDIAVMGLVAGVGTFGIRTLSVLFRYPELEIIKALWAPMLVSGFLFFGWSVEDLVFDVYAVNRELAGIIVQMTLLCAILVFSLGVLRFSSTWLAFAKKSRAIANGPNRD